ncbi:MAG: cache domain-containing protein, partial [Alphaproteobacteria bacterium]|nr:cache domain-containing protein [Alphaproteobacteria bacterium]
MSFLMRVSLGKLLPLIIISLVFLSTIIVGIVSFIAAQNALSEEAEKKLYAVTSARSSMVETYFRSMEQDVATLATSAGFQRIVRDFEGGWSYHKGDAQADFKKLYITDNPNPADKRDLLDIPEGDFSKYSLNHKKHNPWLREYVQSRGFLDLYIFDKAGNLVYTLYKQDDFGTNFLTGEWKDTSLGQAYKKAIELKDPGSVLLVDYAKYAPKGEAVAGFVISPVFNKNNRIRGAVAIQMPMDRLNEIMNESAGLGATGETFIVGSDFLWRSDSRLSDEPSALVKEARYEAVEKALAGETGNVIGQNSAGAKTIFSYAPLNFSGLNWVVIASQNYGEATAKATELGWFVLILLVIVLVVASVVGLSVGRNIAGNMMSLVASMESLAEDAKQAEIPEMDPKTAFGRIARVLNRFKVNMVEGQRLQEEQAAAQEERARRAEQLSKMVADFDAEAHSSLKDVNSATSDMLGAAQNMTSI